MFADPVEPDYGVWRIPSSRVKASIEGSLMLGDLTKVSSDNLCFVFREEPALDPGWPVTARLTYDKKKLTVVGMVQKKVRVGSRYGLQCQLYGPESEKLVSSLLADIDSLKASCVQISDHGVSILGNLGLHSRHDMVPPMPHRRIDLKGLKGADTGGVMLLLRLSETGHQLFNCPSQVAAMLWATAGHRLPIGDPSGDSILTVLHENPLPTA
ncbi:hypothetical protein CCP4SC76_6280014 [Gammaproteobacteria bacterium]